MHHSLLIMYSQVYLILVFILAAVFLLMYNYVCYV